jgi:hypothetical protein
MRTFLLSCSLLVASTPLLAQSPQTISEVHLSTPKPGMTAQWEAGRKQHSAFHAAQKDTWPIFVWQIMTGERTGSYMSVVPNRHWSDYDARATFAKMDAPQIVKDMGASLASTTLSYYTFREDLSLSKPPATPAMMRTNTFYTVIPGHTNDFIDAIKKIQAAIQKTNAPLRPSRFYSLANGGDAPTFVQITDRASWADMEPKATVESVLKEAYGDSGPQILDQFRRSYSKVVTELAVYRPDLSYIPQ